MRDTIKGFRGKDGPILLDYSGVANVPGAIQSIGALTAQPGDHFEVETVDGTGRVVTVKAVAKPGGGSGQNLNLDTTLTKSGEAADAKAVGDALDELEEKIPSIEGLAKTEDIPTKPEDINAQPAGNYLTQAPVESVNGKTGKVQLGAADVGARPDNWVPTAREVRALPDTYTPPDQTAEQVGADPKGTAESAVSAHNTSTDAHTDLRLAVQQLQKAVDAFMDVDDATRNSLSEVLALIDANADVIESITTGKVSVSDIINNLTTNVANKPLSAAQGVVIKGLIDGLSSGKLDAGKLTEAINTALAQAKANGEFDGAKGDPGKTPVRGVDYWTPDDIAAIDADIATELAKRGQLKPEFANSIEECTDTSKLYVLPDGMLYAWMLTEKEVTSGGGNYTNILHLAVNADGSEYVGLNGEDGYKTNYRLNSSKAEVAQDGMCCTGFMPVTPGADTVLRLKHITPDGTKGGYIYGFEADRNTGTGGNSYIPSTLNDSYDAATDTYVLTLATAVGTAAGLKNCSYIRITIGNINENTIITCNEEITESTTETVKEYAWASTGHAFVPADYESRIIAVENTTTKNTARIIALEKSVESGGADETEAAALSKIQKWDKPVYDPAPVTLIADDRVKPALTTNDRTISAIYAKYRALMAAHPDYITETNMGKSSASDTFTAVDMLRFDFCEPDGLTQPDLTDSARHETKPTLIFLSGIHTEWVGVWGLYYALEEITMNPDFDDVRRNARIIVIPCANPYCLAWETSVDGWRMSHVNANGVAIHNNFGVNHSTSGSVGEYNYGGSAPYSEPETQYIDAVMAEYPDAVAFVSCHNNDYSTYYGSHVIWASSATYHMCNLAFRLVDKMTKAWLYKYGQTLKDAIDQYKINMDANDYRLGRATMSTSKGTEQLNATKYGIMGVNLEISRMMKVFSGNTDGTSEVMTHGAEVYANFMRTLLWNYDHKDKKDYAPNLPWSE